LQYRRRNDLSINVQHCEDLWLELETQNNKLILAVIYRHPNKESSLFQDKLCDTLSDLTDKTLNCIVGGDININYLTKNNAKITQYTSINSLTAIGCEMVINNHTRFSENS